MDPWLAAALFQPVTVAFALGVVVALTILAYGIIPGARGFALTRLAGGYAGVLVVTALIAGAGSYVSPSDAQRFWNVSGPEYWHALRSNFLDLLALLSYLAVIAISVIGVPLVLLLNSFGRASMQWILGTSVFISFLAGGFLYVVSGISETRDFIVLDLGTQLFLALGFCIGARVPWRSSAR